MMGGFGNMMGGWGYSYGSNGFGGYALLGLVVQGLFWLGLIALVVYVIRRWTNGPSSLSHNSALDILQVRFAKGEITADEFKQMKQELS